MYRGPQEQVQAGANYPNTGNPGGAYNMDFNRLQSNASPATGKPGFTPAVRNTTPVGSGLQGGAYRPNPRYTPPIMDQQGNVTNSHLQNFDLPYHNGSGGPGGASMGGMMDPMEYLRQLFGGGGLGQSQQPSRFTPSGFPIPGMGADGRPPATRPYQPNQVQPGGQVMKPGMGFDPTMRRERPPQGGQIGLPGGGSDDYLRRQLVGRGGNTPPDDGRIGHAGLDEHGNGWRTWGQGPQGNSGYQPTNPLMGGPNPYGNAPNQVQPSGMVSKPGQGMGQKPGQNEMMLEFLRNMFGSRPPYGG